MESRFTFRAFIAHEEGRLARLETAGDLQVPMNVLCDAETDLSLMDGDACLAEVFGAGSGIRLFQDEADYDASGTQFAMPSVIPAGVFPPDNNTDAFQQEPIILLVGSVENVVKNPAPAPDDPNYFLEVETLEMRLNLFVRYDGEIRKGNVISCEAWIFGNVKKAG